MRYWLTAVLGTLAILAASGDLLSSRHTNHWLVRFLELFGVRLAYKTFAAINEVLRKLGHLTAYGVVSWLWFRAWQQGRPEWRPSWSAAAIASAIVVAICDESLQHLVPSRTGNPQDVLIDFAGALTTQWMIFRYHQRRARLERPAV